MLNEQTMNSIKTIAEAVYVYGTMSKGEAKNIIIRTYGMKTADFLEDGTIFIIDQNNQDVYLSYPLLSGIVEESPKFSM